MSNILGRMDADRLMRTIDFKIVNQGGAGDGEE